MSKIKGRAVAAVAAGAVVVAGGVTAAVAGPVPTHATTGTEYVTIVQAEHNGKESSSETFIAHGVFAGGGLDDASHNNYDVLHFGDGTLTVRHPQQGSTSSFHIDRKTCFATMTISGPYTVGNGTGKYRGVTGHGTYKGSGQFVAKRTASGACDTSSAPRAGIFVIHASGPVTMP